MYFFFNSFVLITSPWIHNTDYFVIISSLICLHVIPWSIVDQRPHWQTIKFNFSTHKWSNQWIHSQPTIPNHVDCIGFFFIRTICFVLSGWWLWKHTQIDLSGINGNKPWIYIQSKFPKQKVTQNDYCHK